MPAVLRNLGDGDSLLRRKETKKTYIGSMSQRCSEWLDENG